MELNWILPHIQNHSSNYEALLQKDEACFNSGKAEGDIGFQEDNPVPALRFQFQNGYWSCTPSWERNINLKSPLASVFPFVLLQMALSSGIASLGGFDAPTSPDTRTQADSHSVFQVPRPT